MALCWTARERFLEAFAHMRQDLKSFACVCVASNKPKVECKDAWNSFDFLAVFKGQVYHGFCLQKQMKEEKSTRRSIRGTVKNKRKVERVRKDNARTKLDDKTGKAVFTDTEEGGLASIYAQAGKKNTRKVTSVFRHCIVTCL